MFLSAVHSVISICTARSAHFVGAGPCTRSSPRIASALSSCTHTAHRTGVGTYARPCSGSAIHSVHCISSGGSGGRRRI